MRVALITILAILLVSCSPPQNQVQGAVVVVNDIDNDFIVDANDNCKTVPNNNQINTDQDLLGDACDPTPFGACKQLCENLIAAKGEKNAKATSLGVQCNNAEFHLEQTVVNECEEHKIKAYRNGECCCRSVDRKLARDCELQKYSFEYEYIPDNKLKSLLSSGINGGFEATWDDLKER